MDELIDRVASNLRELRESRGLSVSQLAARSGIAKSTLSQIEAGATNPTLGTLVAITDALTVSVESLISRAEHEPTVIVRAGEGHDVSGASLDGVLAFTMETGPANIEFHSLSLPPGGHEISTNHGSGSREHVLVTEGTLFVGPEDERHELHAGDLASYSTSGLHLWENTGAETARFWVVAVFPRR
ncbi:MAG TPA: XRE family transcriptional regulator [Pseudolysinimonas sp.]|nr:XRE family transcriptional regulator [Pseudolysinimonas sp.]